jgi:peptide deformylase
MAIHSILRYPDPRLRSRSERVTEISEDLKTLVADMTDTMFSANGAGLAAVQVGVPIALYILDAYLVGGRELDEPLVFINPEITFLSKDKTTEQEGCLSFPSIVLSLTRAARAGVKAIGLDGKEFELEGEGYLARAFQHEGDHLVGRLMIDHVGALRRAQIEKQLKGSK